MTQNLKIILIDLPIKELAGFRHFLSSWLMIDEKSDKTLLIDVGPASTVPVLVQTIEGLGFSRLDLILLTHVHLDHSGGLGQLLKVFKSTKVVAHPRGGRAPFKPGSPVGIQCGSIGRCRVSLRQTDSCRGRLASARRDKFGRHQEDRNAGTRISSLFIPL